MGERGALRALASNGPGECKKAVGIEAADVAGADAAAGMNSDCAVLVQIAERMIGPAAKFDIADLAGRQPAPVAVDNRDVMVGERPAHGAEAARLPRTG